MTAILKEAMTSVFRGMAQKIVPETVDNITETVRAEIHDQMAGPIAARVVRFLDSELDLANIDFFLLLASLQPHYDRVALSSPAMNGATTVSAVVKGGTTTTSSAAPAAAATVAGSSATALLGSIVDDQMLQASRGALDEVPDKLADMVKDDAFMRRAFTDGFRELFHALAKDETTMTAFREAVGARIRHLVPTRPAEDKSFTDIVTANQVLQSSLENYAQNTVGLFRALRQRIAVDGQELPLGSTVSVPNTRSDGDGGKFPIAALRRQRAKMESLYEDMQRAHALLGDFLKSSVSGGGGRSKRRPYKTSRSRRHRAWSSSSSSRQKG